MRCTSYRNSEWDEWITPSKGIIKVRLLAESSVNRIWWTEAVPQPVLPFTSQCTWACSSAVRNTAVMASIFSDGLPKSDPFSIILPFCPSSASSWFISSVFFSFHVGMFNFLLCIPVWGAVYLSSERWTTFPQSRIWLSPAPPDHLSICIFSFWQWKLPFFSTFDSICFSKQVSRPPK